MADFRHRSRTLSSFFIFLLLLLLQISSYSAASPSQLYIEDGEEEEEEDVRRSNFPQGFLFGAATSSYQVEGAYLEDGKGVSNWDIFSHIPGKTMNSDNGDIADDHYHRFLEDIELMHSLGIDSYRFSISWARVLPRGKFGPINPAGISFYNNLIDSLLLKGIEPFVTITHHDVPQELENRYGAWLSPLIQDDFVHFAKICFESFGDRVKHWTTFNEPNLLVDMGYIRGTYPPAHCSAPFGNCSTGNSDSEPLIAMHNILLSHARAAQIYRQEFKETQGGWIGIIANTFMYEPLRVLDSDRKAVARALAFKIAWMFDPLVFGDYPYVMRRYLRNELPRFSSIERDLVKGSIDFIGINHYSSLYVKDCIHSFCGFSGSDRPICGFIYTTGERDGIPIGEPTAMDRFFVVPEGMEKIIDYLKERYGNMPMYVTENGYAPPAEEKEQVKDLLLDHKRIKFHKAYLAALRRAISKGADVRGYFVWSLMDNFEWTHGYSKMFGLVHVNRESLERTPKLSFGWYRDFLVNDTNNNVLGNIIKIKEDESNEMNHSNNVMN